MKDLKIGLYLHRLKEKIDVKDVKSPLHCRTLVGVQALKSHAKGKKHKQVCAAVAVFLKTKPITKSTTSSPDLSPVSSTSSSSGRHVTQTLELTVTKSETLSAEIQWALQSVLKGLSNNSSSNISPLFNVMFPDSKIKESFALGADKLHYLITYGIAPYFHDLLKDNVWCVARFGTICTI